MSRPGALGDMRDSHTVDSATVRRAAGARSGLESRDGQEQSKKGKLQTSVFTSQFV